ncbi:hypothetical protein KFL_001130060 [Klebsormidium nitens]|uniref:RNA-binding S4 domain-containing protein n=1 Tax=Klebsormidium nitens TaxID=105231 RepID=A0A0U9HM32_KLENI|nr:hypothetical protein KFL_001130060 [Klebsormidium nitens]|eukprot:GAQ82487.1 hypothetical protein KFL_001130060 [Klebsormidium nitens]
MKGERLDAFLVANLPQASRSKIQTSIKSGFVLVDGQPQLKPSLLLRGGEFVRCSLPPPPPSDAIPEDIPLDIVYEDDHVVVINKRADMVVHPAAGHSSGTLVNALLFHCDLPTAVLSEADEYSDELDEDVELDDTGTNAAATSTSASGSSGGAAPHVRPGIVHRLDKGTSGLLVVAKDERSLKGLSKQFKDRTVKRSYLSILCGVPDPPMARIDAPIGRDPRDRKRQTVIEGLSNASRNRSRHAASKYRVREWLAGGACGLVEWRLETGRTHQIRVHAKYVGHPVLGDETYGCTSGLVLNSFQRTLGPPAQSKAKQLLAALRRPMLHAKTLGFVHPWTGEELLFTSDLPSDFEEVLDTLKSMNPDL